MSSTFYPTAIYMSDLTRCMSGLSQIFPTKFVACTITTEPGKDKPIPGFDTIKTKTEGEPVVDYTETRKALWKSLKGLNPTGSCYGDINFIGTSLEGGKNLSEVYIQIDKDVWNRPYIFQEAPADPTSLENLKDKRTTIDGTNYTGPVANMAPVERASKESYTFNAIILYYNLYLVDPSGQSSGVKPVCTELPMGIYYLGQNKEVKERSVTRLNMLIGADKNAVPVSTGQASLSTYAALNQSLLAFSQGFEAIRKEVASPKIGKYIGGVIQEELDSFRNERAVNVPYIKDGYWFVNGRKYGKAYGLTSTDDEKVKKIVEDKAQEYIKDNPDEFRGEPGKDGDPGKDGAGLNIKDVLNSESDRPAVGENPGDAYVIGTDLHIWSSRGNWVIIHDFKGTKGEKGDPGKDGAPGEPGKGIRFRGELESESKLPPKDNEPGDFFIVRDNIFIWDGVKNKWVNGDALRGPAGKKGDQGAPGSDGKDLTFESGEFILQPCDEIDICLVYKCIPGGKNVLSPIYSCVDGICSIVNRSIDLDTGKVGFNNLVRPAHEGLITKSTMRAGGMRLPDARGPRDWDDGENRYQEQQDELGAIDADGNVIHPNPGFDLDDITPGEGNDGVNTVPFYSWTSFIDYDVTARITNIKGLRDGNGNLQSNVYNFKKAGFNHTGLKLPMWGYLGGAGFYDEEAGYGKYKSNKNVDGNILSAAWRAEKNGTKKDPIKIGLKDFKEKVVAGKIPGVTLDGCKNFIQVRCMTIRPSKFIQAQTLNQLMAQRDFAFRFSALFHSCAGTDGNDAMMYGAPNVDLYVCGYRTTGGVRQIIPGTEHIFPIDGEMRPLKFHSGLEWTQTESRRALFNMTYDPVSRVTMIVPEGLSYSPRKPIASKNEIQAAIKVMNEAVAIGDNQ